MSKHGQLVDDATHDFLMAIYEGANIAEAMQRMALAHAERLGAMGKVSVLALDPCPGCGGNVLAGENIVKCAAGCGWSYREQRDDPIASRRADP